MPIWLFALIVLLFGIGFAYFLDRMKVRPPSLPGTSLERIERARWLHYWFFGRFPNKKERSVDDAAAGNEKEAGREQKREGEKEERRGD